MHRRRAVRRATFALVAAASVAHVRAAAADTWKAVANGTFATGTNWTDGTAPTSADSAAFNLAGAYTVTFTTGPTNTDLLLSAGTVAFQAAGAARTYTLSNSASLTGGSLTLAGPAATPLTLAIAGPLTTSNNALAVNAGSDLTATTLEIGSLGDSTLTVDGAGSSLAVAGTALLGRSGNAGTVTFQNAATGTFSGSLGLASSTVATSTGTLTIRTAAAVTVAGAVTVAASGVAAQSGDLTVDAATFTQTGPSGITVGASANSAGTLRVKSGATLTTGTGLLRVNRTGLLDVGTTGTGTLNANGGITVDGGTVTLGSGALNWAPGRTLTAQNNAAVTVAGNFATPAGSTLQLSGASTAATFGGLLAVAGGSQLTLDAGAEIFADTFTIPGGNVTVDGGPSMGTMIHVLSGPAPVAIGQGGASSSLTLRNGALFSTGTAINVLDSGAGTGSLSLHNSALTNVHNINVAATAGTGGTGTVLVADDSNVHMLPGAAIVVGAPSGSTASFTVDSGGWVSTGSSGTTTVNRTGTLVIGNGGEIQAHQNISVNGGTFRRDAGGTLTHDAGKSFTVSNGGAASFAGDFTPAGPLTVSGVGSRLDATGALDVGNSLSASVGTSSALNVGSISIGDASTGTLNLTGGTLVASAAVAQNVVGRGPGRATLTLSSFAGASFAAGLYVAGVPGTTDSAATLTVQSGSSLTASGGLFVATSSAGPNDGTVTVTGPGSSLTQPSISRNVDIGSSGSSAGTLNVTALGSFANAGTTRILPNGTVNIDGGYADLGNLELSPGGTLNFVAGSLAADHDLVVSPTGLLGPNLTLAPNRSLAVSSVTIDPFQTLTLDGGSLTTTGPSSSFTNNGTFVFNSGRLTLGSPLTVGPAGPLGPYLSLGPGRTLNATSFATTVEPLATLSIDGGSFTGNYPDVAGTLALNAGSLAFTGAGAITPTGLLALGPNASASFSSLTNQGEINLSTNSTLGGPVGSVTNSGLIRGDGKVAKPLTNASAGELRAEAGKRLEIEGAIGTSAGRITLQSGTLEFSTPLTNAGTITGRGTLIAPAGLTNAGQIQLSAGLTDVYAPVTNAAGATIIVTAAAAASFYDPVTLDAGSEFRVSAGSAASFLAPVSGTGAFTGPGTKYFEAGASAPASIDTAAAGASVVLESASLTTAYLREASLTSYGPTALTPDAPTSLLHALDLSTDGSLDLANNKLILDLPGAPDVNPGLTRVRQYLLAHQLFSSIADADPQHRLALGYADNALLNAATWGGLPADPTSLLLELTYQGDANLDGQLNADDYALLDKGFSSHGTFWWQGDFNYDGTINQDDYLLIDTTYGQAQGFSPGFLSLRESQFGAAYVTQLLTTIPEPTPSSILYPLSSLFLLPRRHRLHR